MDQYSEHINPRNQWTLVDSVLEQQEFQGFPLWGDSCSESTKRVEHSRKPMLRRRVQPRTFSASECPPLKEVLALVRNDSKWTLHEDILGKEYYAGSGIRISKQFFEWLKLTKKDRLVKNTSLKSDEDCLKLAHQIYLLILSLGYLLEHKESKEQLWTYSIQDLIVWMDMVWRDTWYSYLKNTLIYLFNKYEDLEDRVYPDILKMDFHLHGLLYFHNYQQQNRLVQLISGNKKRQIAARWTLLQGLKKGMPHCGEESIYKDCLKHSKLLTTAPAEPPDYLKASLRSILHQIFPKKIYLDDWRSRINQTSSVSSSASFERKRSEGGPLSLLYNFALKKECYQDLQRRITMNLLLPDLLGVLVSNRGVRFVHGPSFEFDIELNGAVNLTISKFLLFGPLHENDYVPANQVEIPDWVNDFNENLDDIGSAFRKCYVKLIKEPLKNRPITVQSAFTNAFLQPIQKLMWKALQEFKIFSLTGKEVEESDIEWLNRDNNLPFFKSGDYQSATDGLNKFLTSICIEEIAGDQETRRLMEIALLEQVLDYSEAYDFSEEQLEFLEKKYGSLPDCPSQKNGQLMGCVLSFPLLCIINAAVLGYVQMKRGLCRSFEQGPDIKTMKALINGDDILFKCDHDLHEDWQAEIIEAGFLESPGKSYLSKHFAMINSTYFRTSGDKVKRFGYINYSWITGIQKGKDFESDSISDLTCLSKDFFNRNKTKRTLESWREKALGMIHSFRSEELKRLPLDVSQDEGGLGLPTLEPVKNPFYQRFSTWLSCKGKSLKSLGTFGEPLLPSTMVPSKVLTVNSDNGFQFRELVSEFKKSADYKGKRSWVPCSYEILEKQRRMKEEKLHSTNSICSYFSNRCLDSRVLSNLSDIFEDIGIKKGEPQFLEVLLSSNSECYLM